MVRWLVAIQYRQRCGNSAAAARRVIVVTGFEPLASFDAAIGGCLRAVMRAGGTVGTVDTGVFVLAEAGVAGAGPVTLHWEAQAAFCERYPAITVTQELFEIGTCCITCAGGTAALDLMLARAPCCSSRTWASL